MRGTAQLPEKGTVPFFLAESAQGAGSEDRKICRIEPHAIAHSSEDTAVSRWQPARIDSPTEGAMPDSGFVTLEDRIERLEDKIDQLSDTVFRIADDLESGFAELKMMSDQEFKQLKQAIMFWSGRARAIDDRDGFQRHGTL